MTLPIVPFSKEQISPTRDTRLALDAIGHALHALRCRRRRAGLSAQGRRAGNHLVKRDTIERSDEAYTETPTESRRCWPLAPIPTTSNSAAAASSPTKPAPDARRIWSSARAAKPPANGTPKQRKREAEKSAAILGATIEFVELDGDAHLEMRAAHAIKLAGIIRRDPARNRARPEPGRKSASRSSAPGPAGARRGPAGPYGGLKELRSLAATCNRAIILLRGDARSRASRYRPAA